VLVRWARNFRRIKKESLLGLLPTGVMNGQARQKQETTTMSMAMEASQSSPPAGAAMPATGDYVDLHELAKGWKAAIARTKDPATR